jgi:hypothetical protein
VEGVEGVEGVGGATCRWRLEEKRKTCRWSLKEKKRKKKDLAVLAGFDNESGCMLACGWSGFSEC